MSPSETIIKQLIKNRIKTPDGLSLIKRKIAKKYNTSLASNIALLKAYHKLLNKKRIKKSKILEKLLQKHPIRSLSGVVVVSVLTKPYPCPGKCIFCPSEKGIPKSYLSGEPAVERAKMLNFDPYVQVQKRLEMLKDQGHPTDKVELRIIGATFTYYPKQYQSWFIKKCFDGANQKKSKNLEQAQKKNEKAKNRIVGMSIETRPDLITKKEILNLRKLGITMVELGAQTVFDDILKKNKRGHSVKETINATKLLKDAGFKIMYQMMPNLLGSNLKKDLECFKIIFNNPVFKPDWLKIYPCMVCRSSKLYQIWKQGKFKPYSDKQLIELLIKIKKILPYWVRVGRLFRDIPSQKIEAGSKISNLRQVVQKQMAEKNIFCKCIRCREVREKYDSKEKIYLFREDYNASSGKEIFLSFENKNRTKLFGFLRLRLPIETKETRPPSSIIRELHIFGRAVPVSEKKSSPQHRGLGKKLIKQAEKITKKEFNVSKIAIISGIGVRGYYRKLGYRLKNTYMIKKL
ncbi:tRNA uridine(34) 5-carboxymethylaminomethyl modification radical SAM/GNAT enzyme Elp3 [Candidatus Parcubacteria bacterium]|nr:tRNA uridine(34) 5-carboxymethylaminomethyl modification radical SAM/GNAT enzyme Elp3 [Candidatus Parcubacteria bacterium]